MSKCVCCNKKNAHFFIVPINSWYEIVPERWHKKILCFKCYNQIRKEKGFKELEWDDWEIHSTFIADIKNKDEANWLLYIRDNFCLFTRSRKVKVDFDKGIIPDQKKIIFRFDKFEEGENGD